MKAINDLISSATIYRARTVVINPLVGRRRSAGVANLEDVAEALPGLSGVYCVWTDVTNLFNE